MSESKVKVENISNSKVKLTIKVSAEEFSLKRSKFAFILILLKIINNIFYLIIILNFYYFSKSLVFYSYFDFTYSSTNLSGAGPQSRIYLWNVM